MNNRRTSGVRAYARKALTPAAVAGVAGLAFAPQLALADDAAADAATELSGVQVEGKAALQPTAGRCASERVLGCKR